MARYLERRCHRWIRRLIAATRRRLAAARWRRRRQSLVPDLDRYRRSGRCDRRWRCTASIPSAPGSGSTRGRACTRSTRPPTGSRATSTSRRSDGGGVDLAVGAGGQAVAPASTASRRATGSRTASCTGASTPGASRRSTACSRGSSPSATTTAATGSPATWPSGASCGSCEDEMTLSVVDDRHDPARGRVDVRHPRLRHGPAPHPHAARRARRRGAGRDRRHEGG